MSGGLVCVNPALTTDRGMGIVVKVIVSADGGRARTGAFGVADLYSVIQDYLSDGYALEELEIEHWGDDRP